MLMTQDLEVNDDGCVERFLHASIDEVVGDVKNHPVGSNTWKHRERFDSAVAVGLAHSHLLPTREGRVSVDFSLENRSHPNRGLSDVRVEHVRGNRDVLRSGPLPSTVVRRKATVGTDLGGVRVFVR